MNNESFEEPITKNIMVFVRLQVEIGFLIKIVQHIEPFVSESRLECTPAGIDINAMDNDHIGLYRIHIDKDDCIHYDHLLFCTNSKMGINLSDFLKVLKGVRVIPTKSTKKRGLIRKGRNEQITLEIGDKGYYIFTDDTEIFLEMLEIETETINTASLDALIMHNSVELLRKELFYACKAVRYYSDVVIIGTMKNELYIKTEGHDGLYRYHIPVLSSVITEPFASDYSVFYMMTFLEKLYVSSIKIQFETDKPIRVNFTFGHKSWGQFYLAPRVEEYDGKSSDTEEIDKK